MPVYSVLTALCPLLGHLRTTHLRQEETRGHRVAQAETAHWQGGTSVLVVGNGALASVRLLFSFLHPCPHPLNNPSLASSIHPLPLHSQSSTLTFSVDVIFILFFPRIRIGRPIPRSGSRSCTRARGCCCGLRVRLSRLGEWG
jgi:hypothetical protein